MASDQERERRLNAAKKAIEELGHTYKEVAATLERRHARGVPSHIRDCPLARHLSEVVGAPVWVTGSALGVGGRTDIASMLNLPFHLRQFVYLFDGGAFPQLKDHEEIT